MLLSLCHGQLELEIKIESRESNVRGFLYLVQSNYYDIHTSYGIDWQTML